MNKLLLIRSSFEGTTNHLHLILLFVFTTSRVISCISSFHLILFLCSKILILMLMTTVCCIARESECRHRNLGKEDYHEQDGSTRRRGP